MKNACSMLLLPLVASFLFMLGACDPSVMYTKNQHLGHDAWLQNDTLFYSFDLKDTLSRYDFYIDVRNTTDYSFQNLYLFVTAYYPGYTYSRDTAECILAAPDGEWYGKGMGKHRTSRFLFRKAVQFRHSGNYVIALNQAMRVSKLDGISEVGIYLKKSE